MKKQNFKISLVTVLYWLSDKINNLNILGSIKYVSIIVQLISSFFTAFNVATKKFYIICVAPIIFLLDDTDLNHPSEF